jgi:cardiolipin synthase (CMP-forming)
VERAEEVPVDDEPGMDRILTIPNVISVIRLSMLPVFLWLLFAKDDRSSAAWLLGALGATDFLDGYIARRYHQVSNIGKILDPVADRLLFFVGAGAILIDGSVPVWFAIAVLVREVLLSGATIALAAMGVRRIDVTWFGKAGTFGLMIAFPLFLGSNDPDVYWADTVEVMAWMAAIPGLILSYYSAFLYIPLARDGLREARESNRTTRVRSAP